MAKKKEPTDQNNERVRQIGATRMETVVQDLSPMALDECKSCIAELLNKQDAIKMRAKVSAKAHKDELAIVLADLAVFRSEVATGKRRLEIEVAEYLTKSNEIIRVRSDTGEIIGARTARASELQEEMDLESDGDADGEFKA